MPISRLSSALVSALDAVARSPVPAEAFPLKALADVPSLAPLFDVRSQPPSASAVASSSTGFGSIMRAPERRCGGIGHECAKRGQNSGGNGAAAMRVKLVFTAIKL